MPQRTFNESDFADAPKRTFDESDFQPKFPLGGPLRLPLQPKEATLSDEMSRIPGEAWNATKQLGSAMLHTSDSPSAEADTGGLNGLLLGGASLSPLTSTIAKPAARSLAARLYESALKPGPRSNTIDEIRNMVDTGLKEGIPVSYGGVKKARTLVGDLSKSVTGEIAKNPTAPISKFRVVSRIGDAVPRLAAQANPEADLEALSESGNEFLRSHPSDIPAEMAQQIKVGTGKKLGDAAFGELKRGSVEGQKQIRRGLREELESYFPNIRDLNAREGKIIDLQPELEAAVNRGENRNLLGFGTPLIGAGVELATGSTPAAMLAGAAKEFLGAPSIKSRLAIGLSRFGRVTPQAETNAARLLTSGPHITPPPIDPSAVTATAGRFGRELLQLPEHAGSPFATPDAAAGASESFARGIPAELAKRPFLLPESAGSPFTTPAPAESLLEQLRRFAGKPWRGN